MQISKFDGDPNKIAIWGISAGAGSVLQHVIENGGITSPPLFRAAITSSTFLPSQYYYDDRIPEVCSCHVIMSDPSSPQAETYDSYCIVKLSIRRNIFVIYSGSLLKRASAVHPLKTHLIVCELSMSTPLKVPIFKSAPAVSLVLPSLSLSSMRISSPNARLSF
jgi:hypothetical protein